MGTRRAAPVKGGRWLGCAGLLHPRLSNAPREPPPFLTPIPAPRPLTPAGCCPHGCWHPCGLRARGQRRQCLAGRVPRVPELATSGQAGRAAPAGCVPSAPCLGRGTGTAGAGGDHSRGRDPLLSPAHPTTSPAPVRAPTGPSQLPSIQALVPSARRLHGPACHTPGSMEMSCLGPLLL